MKKNGKPRETMTRAKALETIRSAALTAAMAFTLITLAYFILTAVFIDAADTFSYRTFSLYTLGRLGAILLFSVYLGVANRFTGPDKSRRALRRLIHFVVTAVVYGLTMILLFHWISTPVSGKALEEVLTVQSAGFYAVLGLLGYFVTLGVTALGRLLFRDKKSENYRSILD